MKIIWAVALSLPLLGATLARTDEDPTVVQNVYVKFGETLQDISSRYLKEPIRWREILKRNRLPTLNPTAPLPIMTLRLPVAMVKEPLRAAYLTLALKRVMYRPRGKAGWRRVKLGMALYEGDSLRTFDKSRARVKFMGRELLRLEQNSMAVVQMDQDTPARAGLDFVGRARATTTGAKVEPLAAGARYSSVLDPDLTTRVEVYTGRVAVIALGQRVEVTAGMGTRVKPGHAPEPPLPLTEMPVPGDMAALRRDLDTVSGGASILGYHVQAASDRDFSQVVFDRRYEKEERYSPGDAQLPPGAYWWRVALVDLIGSEGRYGEPRYYRIGP